MRAILVYALLRAALFLAPFALLVAWWPWYVALLVALLFAFAASSVFLRRFREAAVAELARMRGARGERADEDAEDEALAAEHATETDDAAVAEDDDSLADPRAVDGTTTTTEVDPDVVTDAQAEADASRERDGR